VVHTCNPSYLGGGDRRIMVGAQSEVGGGETLEKPYLKEQVTCGGTRPYSSFERGKGRRVEV
jgi:hypothetical protein